LAKALLGNESVNTLKSTQQLLGNKQRTNEFAGVSAATVAMQ
jgi:hypothetical protein